MDMKPVLTSNVPELPDTIGELNKLEILNLRSCLNLTGMINRNYLMESIIQH